MRTFFALWKRELAALFLSPIAYVMMMFFLMVTGFGFYFLVRSKLELSLAIQGLVVIIWGCMLVVIPILTMRTFAEERKNGTFETLMTAPVRESSVVLAKFCGVLTFFLMMCLPTLLYVPIVCSLSPGAAEALDSSAIIGGYLGMGLIASAVISLGMLASALTANQIISAIASFSVMCVIWVGGLFLPTLSTTGNGQEVSSYFSSALHLMEASRSVFDSRTLVLYITLTFFFLFATIRAIEARR